MERKIRLIWEFRGMYSKKTAEHHAIHLSDFAKQENLIFDDSGTEEISDMYTIAYMIIMESELKPVSNALKPHKAFLAES